MTIFSLVSSARSRAPAWRRRPLVAALGIAVAAAAPQSHGAVAVAHWTVTDLGGSLSAGWGINNTGQVTGYSAISGHAFLYSNGAMTDLGTLGGNTCTGWGINNAGQVTGYSNISGNSVQHAFVYRNGAITDLGTLGGTYSWGYGINNSGQVTGASYTSGNGPQHAFLHSNGAMTDLGTLGGVASAGNAINDAGQVTGFSALSGNAARHAFLYSKGAMTDLGTLGGATSEGSGINNVGQVTGYSFTSTNAAQHAFAYSNGAMTDLGTLGGAASFGYGINNAGLITGIAYTGGNVARAFLYSNGTMRDLNSFNGIAGGGLTLRDALSINDVGQITGSTVDGHPYIATLDTTVWQGAANTAWESTSSWSHGIAPSKNTQAIFDPAGSRTALGPAGTVQARQLTIGGDGTTTAIATLQLAGGTIDIVSDSGTGATISSSGVLTGRGVIGRVGAQGYNIFNYGRIVADDVTMDNFYVYNYGTIEGNGRLSAKSGIYNNGLVALAHPGERLSIDGTLENQNGRVEVLRGEVAVSGVLTNFAAAQISLRDGTLRTQSLNNQGRLDISSGASDVLGDVTNQAGARIAVSGQGQATFWGVVNNYGEFRVSSGAVATFFGNVFARSGGTLTGSGAKFYEAGFAVGNSPGVAVDEGDTAFGSDAQVAMEIGGLSAGTGDGFHDLLVVKGSLGLGGTLKLTSWKSFQAQAGQRFDLFDWGSVSGTFDSIDATGLVLAPGSVLDTSRLYIDGSIGVLAVPEPDTWALMLGGLALGGLWRRQVDLPRHRGVCWRAA